MISPRSEPIVNELEASIDRLLGLGARCDANSWLRTTVAEGWTVAAVFHHVSVGNRQLLRWMKEIVAGRATTETWQDVHRANAEHARLFSECEQMATLRLLRTVRDEGVAFLESLSDVDLDQSASCGLYDEERSVSEVAEWMAGHATDHLDSLRAVLPAAVTSPDPAGEIRPLSSGGGEVPRALATPTSATELSRQP